MTTLTADPPPSATTTTTSPGRALLNKVPEITITRPLGANLGDWIAVDKQLGGIGVGTLGTSAIFLGAIVATVTFLAVKRPDVIEDWAEAHVPAPRQPERERKMLAYQAGAVTRIADLETAWDDAQPTLEPLDGTAWTFLDSEIDAALTTVRASSPDAAAQEQALSALVASLAG